MPQIIEVPGHGQVEFPDGMSDNQIVAAIKANAPHQPNEAAMVPEVSTPFGTMRGETSSGFNPAAALIKAGSALTSLQRGADQLKFGPADWIREKVGLQAPGTGISDALKAGVESEKPYIKDLETVNPGSSLIGDMLPALGVPWRTLPVIAASEYGSPLERLQKGGVTYLGGKLAQKGGEIASRAFANSEASAAATAGQNATRDTTAQLARDNGFALPPTQTNPTLLNRALEGYAGKTSTEQALSIKNQPLTDLLIKRDMGLPLNKPASEEAIAAVRTKAYNDGYAPIKQQGALKADNQFKQDVSSLGGEDYSALIREVPEEANAKIDRLVSALNKDEFSGSTAVNLIRKYRSDAAANFKNQGDPEALAAAHAQLAAAEALEGMVERNLAARGMPDAVAKFRDARVMIAKAHEADVALNKATGSFDAAPYGKAFDRGKPQSGGAKTVGQIANAFPKAMKEVNTSMPGISPLDYAAVGGVSAATGIPAFMAALVGRPAARAAITSRHYQNLFTVPQYRPNQLLGATAGLLDNPLAPYGAGLLAYEANR